MATREIQNTVKLFLIGGNGNKEGYELVLNIITGCAKRCDFVAFLKKIKNDKQ